MAIVVANMPEHSRKRVFVPGDFEEIAERAELVFVEPKDVDESGFREYAQKADAMLTCWGSTPLTAAAVEGRATPLLVAHAAGSVRSLVPKDLLLGPVRLSQGNQAIAPAVAQYTVGLIILALRQSLARTDAWRHEYKYTGEHVYRELTDLTVGLWGLSQVGRRVPKLLKPFDCKVIAYDPYAPESLAEELGIELVGDLDTLIERSDVLSLHAPVTDETVGMLDARRVGLLRPGSVVVNTARPSITDQDALFARAAAGEIQFYTDVTDPEPLPGSHPIWNSPNVYIAPHIAGPTEQTMRRMATGAVDEILRFLDGEPLLSEVTYERYDVLA